MTLLNQAKNLGGIGSVLIILVFVPGVGWLLALAGFILVLFAVKYIADALNDRKIFNDMIISVIASIAGIVVAGLYIFASLAAFIGFSGMTLPGEGVPSFTSGDVISLILTIIIGLAIVWIALIISAVFLRRSYSAIGRALNVNMFNNAALLYLIGAATTIIAIGFLLLLVAEVLQILAFFGLPDNPPQMGPSTAPQPQPV